MVVGPLRETCRAVLVAKHTILCIRHKPLPCLGKEILESLAVQHLAAFLCKEQTQIIYLGAVYLFVVNLRQDIELLAKGFEVVALFGIRQRGQLTQVGILGMDGKDADAAVRVRVGPCVCGGGIVDGQYLQHALAGTANKVDHPLEVAEVAHAKATLRPKREHGHERSGQTNIVKREESLVKTVHNHLALLHLRKLYSAVVARFPERSRLVLGVEGDKLKLNLAVCKL